MGGANNICSDKTGTLTKNLMTVTKIFIEQAVHESLESEIVSEHTCKILCLSVCNNSNANPIITHQKGSIAIEQIGNKTECALIEMAYRMGYDYKKFRNKDHIVKIFPFSSERKKMATIYQDDKGAIYVFVKGAPDFLIPYCSKFIDRNGRQSKLTSEFSDSLQQTIVDFANESLRTLLLSYKEVSQVPE